MDMENLKKIISDAFERERKEQEVEDGKNRRLQN